MCKYTNKKIYKCICVQVYRQQRDRAKFLDLSIIYCNSYYIYHFFFLRDAMPVAQAESLQSDKDCVTV